MISIQSRVCVPGISAAQLVDFMLNCADAQYQAWWPGTHLVFHTIERRPGDVGNVVVFDEFVGKRRLKTSALSPRLCPAEKSSGSSKRDCSCQLDSSWKPPTMTRG